MIRLYWLVRYFNDFSLDRYWANFNNAKDRYGTFVYFLDGEKHFLEDWRDTLHRWYYSITKNQSSEENEKIQLRQRKHLKRIIDVLHKALKREYLLSSGTDLKIDYRGRDFLKPLHFFKACLEEYDPIIRFILGGSLGAIIVGGVWLYNVFNS